MAISIPKRFIITGLAFLGYMFINIIQESLTNVFIEMRNQTNNYTSSKREITQIEEANTLGFLVTFIGGAIATTYGGAITFGIGTGLSACLAILSPALRNVPLNWVIRVKYLDGLLQGLAYCGVADLWARWSLLEERARVVSIAMSGAHFGALLEHIIPVLGANNIIPYTTIFSVIGGSAAIWSIIWLLYVRSDPSKDDSISENEKTRLAYRIKYVGTHRVLPENYPWKEILTSKPVWAIFTVSFLNSCGFGFYYYHVPSHMIDKGMITEETYHRIRFAAEICTAIFWFPAGYICDRARTKYNPTQVSKRLICIGFLSVASLLVLYVVIGFNSSFTIPMLILFYMMFPLGMVLCDLVYMVNVIDLSPKYASLISGIEITFFTIGELLSSYLLVNLYTSTTRGYDLYLPYVFVIFSIFYCCGAAVYYFWADTKLQTWNQHPRPENVKYDKRASALSALTVQ
ncbi:vesicular glutamate transporter 3-like [Planococcus citri]|uniref:vesicular glutamate transporter 3-like n=1 Tax=Planococcus citri TaxID=170843 RepID=UPI0031F74EC7